MLARVLELVGEHCDLEQRVKDIPPSARLRGIWVRNIETVLDRRGLLSEYLRYFPARAPTIDWVSVEEVVCRVAVAGALYASPAEMHSGMREVGRAQAKLFASSLLGRSLIRLLAPDPVQVLKQGAAARRQTSNYGRWEHDFSVPRRALVYHREEYCWLDSQVLGSAEGTLEAVGVNARFELRLTDAYNGMIEIDW